MGIRTTNTYELDWEQMRFILICGKYICNPDRYLLPIVAPSLISSDCVGCSHLLWLSLDNQCVIDI